MLPSIHTTAAEAVAGGAILGGDDLTLTIRTGQVTHIAARRGSATGPVVVFEPATPFRLPLLRIPDAPAMRIDSRIAPKGRITDRNPAYCPLVVGARDFEPGDVVAIRWNPRTMRITLAELQMP